jgi:hypothetical protein
MTRSSGVKSGREALRLYKVSHEFTNIYPWNGQPIFAIGVSDITQGIEPSQSMKETQIINAWNKNLKNEENIKVFQLVGMAQMVQMTQMAQMTQIT